MTLKITDRIKFINPTEQARRQVVGLNGILHLDDTQIDLAINDVSVSGLGGYIEGAISRGTELKVEADTPFGNVLMDCEVRYCRPDQPDSIRHRIGLKITKMGRIETAVGRDWPKTGRLNRLAFDRDQRFSR